MHPFVCAPCDQIVCRCFELGQIGFFRKRHLRHDVQHGHCRPGLGSQLTADDVFADWTVANYLDDKNVAGGLYYYSVYPQAPKVNPTETFSTCPVAASCTTAGTNPCLS